MGEEKWGNHFKCCDIGVSLRGQRRGERQTTTGIEKNKLGIVDGWAEANSEVMLNGGHPSIGKATAEGTAGEQMGPRVGGVQLLLS